MTGNEIEKKTNDTEDSAAPSADEPVVKTDAEALVGATPSTDEPVVKTEAEALVSAAPSTDNTDKPVVKTEVEAPVSAAPSTDKPVATTEVETPISVVPSVAKPDAKTIEVPISVVPSVAKPDAKTVEVPISVVPSADKPVAKTEAEALVSATPSTDEPVVKTEVEAPVSAAPSVDKPVEEISTSVSVESDSDEASQPETLLLDDEVEHPVMPASEHSVDVQPSLLASPWRLLLQLGGQSQTTIGIEVRDRILLGRGDPKSSFFPDLDLSPYGGQHGGVSRRHAAIIQDSKSKALYLEDLNSTNGTRINGFALETRRRYRLRDGDVLELGQIKIVLRFVRSPYE